MPAEKNTLVLIDGHSNVHKAYHAIKQPLTNSRGEPTGAVFGFINIFMRLHRDLKFKHVVVVFDPPGPTFRDEMFTDYKATREKTPDDLIAQDRRIRDLLRILGVPMVELPGFEADDVLAALALRAVESGGEALVCSTDKDLLQVVRPGIKVWREHLQKTELLDEKGVFEKLGITPSQVPAYLGLIGDTADNIPGVPGIGPKTAQALLSEYGTIEAILAAAPAMAKPKYWEKIRENADNARLSERLATLNYDCINTLDWDACRWDFRATPELREFYRDMGFHTLLRELGGDTVEERTVDYRTVRTRAELETAVAELRAAGLASIDTETNALDPFTADLVGIAISWRKNQAVYIPVGHAAGGNQASLADLHAVLGPALADTAMRWVAHHWDYDCKILRRAGFQPRGVASDTMIAAYLANPERGGSLRLKDLALSALGIQMTEISELIGDGDDLVTMANVSVEDSSRYACQDADATLQLHHHFIGQVHEAGMQSLYETVEIPLIDVLAEMELAGVRIDTAHFRKLSEEAVVELDRLTGEIYAIAGREFKINSPKQVGELLFEELKLPSGKKGKSGAFSTDVTVLEGLRHLHPLPAKLLEYRQVEKLKNTYIDPLPTMVHPVTGRVHTSFNQTIAATGRLSSTNPNLQNIPVRTEAGRQIRRGFLPRQEGWKLLAADYSQIELRILAHLSGDEALREAFRTGGDIHALTASKVFGVPMDQVSDTQRSQAKAINFGIIYGMSDFRLSRDLEISTAQAKQFIEDYFQVYQGVRRFIEETKEQARQTGAVSTLLGRRRAVPDINSSNYNARSLAERIAVNTPIQGTSADMIKAAMIRIHRRMKQEGFQAAMILQVHDELIFDVPAGEVERLGALVQKEMAEALPLDVPIRVAVEIGGNWAEC